MYDEVDEEGSERMEVVESVPLVLMLVLVLVGVSVPGRHWLVVSQQASP